MKNFRNLTRLFAAGVIAAGLLAAPAEASQGYDKQPTAGAQQTGFQPAGTERPVLLPELAAQVNTKLHEPQSSRGNVVTVLNDGFEGSFPGTTWQLLYTTEATSDARWGQTNAFSNSGANSVHCAAGGNDAINVGMENYPDGMGTWMIFGPFSMADASAGQFAFSFINDSEQGWDFLYALVSTTPDFSSSALYLHSGQQFNWAPFVVDLGNLDTIGSVIGAPQVYVALLFISDDNTNALGAAVDDVIIVKTTTGPTPSPTPSPTPTITPSPTSPPTPSPSPTASPSPSPTPGGEEKTFQIFNDGNAPLRVESITKENNANWLEIFPPAAYPVKIDPGMNATFRARVTRTGLSNGNYAERLIVTSNDSTKSPYPNGVFINLSIGSVPTPTPSPSPTPSPTFVPTPSPTPSPTPTPSGDAVLDAILGLGFAGPGDDANTDGIIDSADLID